MDTENLKYFISVAQLLNFSEAARQNNVPQPKISRSILELESQLNAKLFFRTNRDVSLTREGETFLPYAIDIVDMADKASDMVDQVHNGRTGYLSIATVSTTSRTLASFLSVFSTQFPDIMIDITQNTGKTQEMAMMENRFDFHFAHLSMLQKNEHLDYVITHRDKLVVVVPKGHKLTKGKLDFDKLFQEKFIMISQPESPQLYSKVMDISAAYQTTPKVIHRYDKAESVLLSVGSGLGVSILPMGLTQAFLPDAVDVIPIDREGNEIEYVCAWPKQSRNPCSKIFLDVVRQYFPLDKERNVNPN
ncbi:MAG: LysR family transcriptional regulator [Clostridiales bacterium]|nr:LysR family transcriptional regulator [Clostridiales bacterium]